jgi:hypothetical protein
MPIPCQSSADAFGQVLRRHDVDPGAVIDIEAAWRAFGEFLQVEVDGVDTHPDAEGFIVQWGRYTCLASRVWQSRTLALALTQSARSERPHWLRHAMRWTSTRSCVPYGRQPGSAAPCPLNTPADPNRAPKPKCHTALPRTANPTSTLREGV